MREAARLQEAEQQEELVLLTAADVAADPAMWPL